MLSLAQGHTDYFIDFPAFSKPFVLFSLAVSDLAAPAARKALRCALKLIRSTLKDNFLDQDTLHQDRS